jgi:hypothetical protein
MIADPSETSLAGSLKQCLWSGVTARNRRMRMSGSYGEPTSASGTKLSVVGHSHMRGPENSERLGPSPA